MKGKDVQMSKDKTKLFIAIFQTENGAEEAVDMLKSGEVGELGIEAMVAILRDHKGRIDYKDVGLTPSKGALGGVVLGAALGVLSGGATVALGALGAIVGGLMGERKRSGKFSSIRMNELVASLVPGSSALVIVFHEGHLKALEDHFLQFEAETFSTEITDDLSEKLDPHRHKDFTDWTKDLKL
jgi:uncharacterized membrane protein